MSQRYRRYARFEAGFPTASGDVRVPVNKSRDQSATGEVMLGDTRPAKRCLVRTNSKDSASADQHMTYSEIFRSEDSGIG
jgi:hypothetical protein